MIHPKGDNIDSEATKKEVQAKISPNKLRIKITKVKKIRNGGILIESPQEEDIDKLIAHFKEIDDLNNTYEILKPKKREPRLVIYNVDKDLTKELLADKINQFNEDSDEERLFVAPIYSYKGRTGFNWVCTTDGATLTKLSGRGKLTIGWERYDCREYLRCTQCFRCGKFGHIGKDCRSKEICLNCSQEGHTRGDCTHARRCNNCTQHNHKFNTRYEVNHAANDQKCRIMIKEIEQLRNRTYYG